MSAEAPKNPDIILTALRKIAEDPLLSTQVTLPAAEIYAREVVSQEQRAAQDKGFPRNKYQA